MFMDMDEPFRHLTQLATYQLVPRRPLVRRIMKATTIASLWIATPLRSPVRYELVFDRATILSKDFVYVAFLSLYYTIAV